MTPGELSHTGPSGEARMVDVGAKADTARSATASGIIRMQPDTLDAIQANTIKKGDVVSVARVAAIMAAKRTAELIPLCHPVALTDVQVSVEPDRGLPGLRVTISCSAVGKTGVEMEALSAVSICLLTIYDMAKGLDRGMEISDITVCEKRGGRSGHWKR